MAYLQDPVLQLNEAVDEVAFDLGFDYNGVNGTAALL